MTQDPTRERRRSSPLVVGSNTFTEPPLIRLSRVEWQENFNQPRLIFYELYTCRFILWQVQQSCQTIDAAIATVIAAKKYRASVDQLRADPGHHQEKELHE